MTINESIYMALSISDASKVNLLLMGNPGSGKTTSVEFFAKANNMKVVLLRGSQSSPEEILGYEVNDGKESVTKDGTVVKVASKICPKWYSELVHNSDNGVRTLLFLDEITTASSFVQSALLQVIFGRSIDNGYNIPEDTLIVAAGNYAGNLSSDFNLIPPLMNRFCIYNVSIKSDDMRAFMSRYLDRQDIVSKLKMFDSMYSQDESSLDKGFVSTVKKTLSSKLFEYVQSLMSSNKYDPNISDMSDIYSDQSTGTKLLGFLTPRTLGYYTDTSIYTYLKYGLEGIKSEVFEEMTLGLVGLSLCGGNGNNSGVKKEVLTSEFIKVVSTAAEYLDKKRINSISSTEDKINRIITKLDSDGNKIGIDVLPSSDLIALSKIFESASSDRDLLKVQNPIDPKIIIECSDVIVSSARNVLSEDKKKIYEIAEKFRTNNSKTDRSEIDLDRINGGLKCYNDAIKAYKALSEFVSKPEFKYQSDLINKINKSDKDALRKNRYRVDSMKVNLRDMVGISMSELVETENI